MDEMSADLAAQKVTRRPIVRRRREEGGRPVDDDDRSKTESC